MSASSLQVGVFPPFPAKLKTEGSNPAYSESDRAFREVKKSAFREVKRSCVYCVGMNLARRT
jgi:hypothetical protein